MAKLVTKLMFLMTKTKSRNAPFLDKYMYLVVKTEVKQLLEVFCTHLYFDNVKFEQLGSGQ